MFKTETTKQTTDVLAHFCSLGTPAVRWEVETEIT